MLFSSAVFWLFYAFVITLLQFNYWAIKSIKLQNMLLLAASYFFYGYWDWKFLSLILIVSAQTYVASTLIFNRPELKKIFLAISIFINLAVLAYFKYANFFISEFLDVFSISSTFSLENIILPVGISFYIFQSFTYVLDVFSDRIRPERDPIKYFAFIAFFPQLVAGPIERASRLLPQFRELKGINAANVYEGTKIIIIGLFLKVFIADSIAPMVDIIFANYQTYNGGTLLLGATGFTIQIYGDFAGYSLIAIGVAKIMGFTIMKNFNTPYFSTSIKEFWQRWHISLSSFFKDYLYIPLGGSRISELITTRNLLLTFAASGLWHGANWTFIVWGIAHGSLLIIRRASYFPLNKIFGWFSTMLAVVLLWILFRSESIGDFSSYIHILLTQPGLPEQGQIILVYMFYYLAIDLMLLFYDEQGKTWLSSQFMEAILLAVMLILVVGTMHSEVHNFIYFQF